MLRYVKSSQSPSLMRYYTPATNQDLKDLGYEFDTNEDTFMKNLFEDYGLTFTGWAIIKDRYFDRAMDNGVDIAAIGVDNQGHKNVYVIIDDRICPVSKREIVEDRW